jgi:NAD(P)H-hydrate epimerase
MIEVTKEVLRDVYKSRPCDAKKYDFGLLLVIGGSDFYSGSPALSAMAAFRSGVDMVRVIAPKRAADIIASFSPNLAAYPLDGKMLEKKHLATLIGMAESSKAVARGNAAVVIGGGLGRSEDTQNAVLEFLKNLSLPAVIDNDAIHAVSKKPQVIMGKNFLITPHTYEFFILTGREINNLELADRMELVRSEAARLNTTILLKSGIDIISNGKDVAACKVGTPWMTKGGCGDTLAGICGALMARGVDPFTAGQAGSFINGKAGEIATEKQKEGLLATDIIDAIPEVIKTALSE